MPIDLIHHRLYTQHLLGPKFETAANVVSHFGAVQAQDYAGAKWAVAQRTTGLNDADLDRALEDGSILRTHVLRPTWHFVTPADIRWMLALTAPRVKAAGAYQWRRLELDEALFKRSHNVLTKTLRDGPLPRTAVATALKRAGVLGDGEQRLSHLLMRAELDGLICSGGRHGKQFTYALLDERAPQAKTLPRDEALATLTLRYFVGHGPATVQDFAWWSGLTLTDAKRGLELAKDQLHQSVIDDQVYWQAASIAPARASTLTATLLPSFDEYTVGYADRSALFDAAHFERLNAANSGVALSNTLLIRGQIVGNWKRTLHKDAALIELMPFRPLTQIEQRAIAKEADRFGAFLGLRVVWA
ncbi:MAG: winged helix DNA-binding domain-containing protein [Anaerolineae bacterium]